jgi:integration host factor subunit alpha
VPEIHKILGFATGVIQLLEVKAGFKINNIDVDSAVLQSALAADLHRAMQDAKVRKEAEKDLPTLTKAELAELLFEQVGLNKREAKDMVETFFDEIRNALERGEAVKLSGFGNFQLRDKPQRPGRNPKTGEAIPITARRVVTFHASQKLKTMVEDATPHGASSRGATGRAEALPGAPGDGDHPLDRPPLGRAA